MKVRSLDEVGFPRGEFEVEVEYASAHGYELSSREGSVGVDLHTAERVVLAPGETAVIKTGIRMSAPDWVFPLLVPRSSIGAKGLYLLNTVGVIDPSYCGDEDEILAKVGLHAWATDGLVLEPGERFAQLILLPYVVGRFRRVERMEGENRGGWGSTGS